jgi:hypothetical protein
MHHLAPSNLTPTENDHFDRYDAVVAADLMQFDSGLIRASRL